MKLLFSLVIVGIVLGCGVDLVRADPVSTAPADAQPPAHRAVIPDGFHAVRVGGRTVFCQASEDDWVKNALASATPATRPTTMPSDIVNGINSDRAVLIQQMEQDLALADSKGIDDMLDKHLIPDLQKIDGIQPTVFYLVATHATLADRMENGWADPRFHYNRSANEVVYSTTAVLSANHPMDDVVWWVNIHDGDNAATRGDALHDQIRIFEGGLAEHLALFGKSQADHALESFIHSQVMEPLKLPGKLQWFDFGVSNIYAIKYTAMLTGIPRKQWTENLIGPPGHPGPWVQIDLVNALDPNEVRPELVGPYGRAMMPKGSFVIDSWIAQGGDGVLAKTLPALRSHAPASSQDLAKLIQDSTGIDVMPWMKPQFPDVPVNSPR